MKINITQSMGALYRRPVKVVTTLFIAGLLALGVACGGSSSSDDDTPTVVDDGVNECVAPNCPGDPGDGEPGDGDNVANYDSLTDLFTKAGLYTNQVSGLDTLVPTINDETINDTNPLIYTLQGCIDAYNNNSSGFRDAVRAVYAPLIAIAQPEIINDALAQNPNLTLQEQTDLLYAEVDKMFNSLNNGSGVELNNADPNAGVCFFEYFHKGQLDGLGNPIQQAYTAFDLGNDGIGVAIENNDTGIVVNDNDGDTQPDAEPMLGQDAVFNAVYNDQNPSGF